MSAVVEAREPRAQYLRAPEPALLHAFDLFAMAPGATGRLRSLILSLAVQGKLIQQDESDVSASDLLAQIRVEVELQEATAEPASPVFAMPFDIPSSWEWASLGEVVDLIRGITFPASEKTREPAPNRIACLRTTNVQQSIEWHDLLFIDRSYMSREAQLIRHHDIVMSMANSRELVGKVALIESLPYAEATFGGFLGVLRPRHIDPRYVMAVLRTDYARQSLIGSASQTTNIANISLAKLRPLPFPLPPIAEQHRIVARVEELMKLCDALEQSGRLADEQHARLTSTLFDALAASESAHALAENWQRVAEHFDILLDRPEVLEAFDQTILQLAVRGVLVSQAASDEPARALLDRIAAYRRGPAGKGKYTLPTAVDEAACPFSVPAGWAWATWDTVAQQIGDIDHKMPQEVADGVPYISPRDFIEGNGINFANAKKIAVTDYEDLASKIRPERGDLIYPRYGTIGKVRLVETDERFLASYSCAIIKCLPEFVDPSYQYLVSISPLIADQAAAATNKTTQPNVGLKSIKAFLFPLPPLAEQRRIVARVKELRRLGADLRNRLLQAREVQSRLADELVAEVA